MASQTGRARVISEDDGNDHLIKLTPPFTATVTWTNYHTFCLPLSLPAENARVNYADGLVHGQHRLSTAFFLINVGRDYG